jgi:hypothetical protein
MLKMNKTLLFLLNLLLCSALFAQNEPAKTVVLFRTHPVAWFGGGANLGCEVRLKNRPQEHYTLGIHRYPALASSWVPNFFKDEGTGDRYILPYNTFGWSVRLGDKFFRHPEAKSSRFYIEPQFRFGKLERNASFSIGDQSNYKEEQQKQIRIQLVTLLGFQHRLGKNVYFDQYIGGGFLSIIQNAVITKSNDSLIPVGTKSSAKFPLEGKLYLGMSFCFDFRSKEEIGDFK